MENNYEQYLHNVGTLILDNQPGRAREILIHLISMGIKTSQIYVLLSYTTRMIDGQVCALRILQKCPNTSPVISMAIAQYSYEIKAYQDCYLNLQQMINTSIETQYQNKNNANLNVKQQVQQPNNGTLEETTNKMRSFHHHQKKPDDYASIQGLTIDTNTINLVNKVTDLYRSATLTPTQAKQHYEKILSQNRPVGKLKQYLKKFILYLSY